MGSALNAGKKTNAQLWSNILKQNKPTERQFQAVPTFNMPLELKSQAIQVIILK